MKVMKSSGREIDTFESDPVQIKTERYRPHPKKNNDTKSVYQVMRLHFFIDLK